MDKRLTIKTFDIKFTRLHITTTKLQQGDYSRTYDSLTHIKLLLHRLTESYWTSRLNKLQPVSVLTYSQCSLNLSGPRHSLRVLTYL